MSISVGLFRCCFCLHIRIAQSTTKSQSSSQLLAYTADKHPRIPGAAIMSANKLPNLGKLARGDRAIANFISAEKAAQPVLYYFLKSGQLIEL